MRKSRRIASFLTLSSSKIEEVSLNCAFLMLSSSKTEEVSQNRFVFKLADRQIHRQLQLQVQIYYATFHNTTLITSNYTTLH